MGNVFKGDDAAGCILSEKLKGRIKAEVINAETTLENFIRPVLKLEPDVVLIIDAVVSSSAPGSVQIFHAEDLPILHFSTHGMSPGLFMSFLKDEGINDIFLIGIEAKTTGMGDALSPEVESAIRDLETDFINALG